MAEVWNETAFPCKWKFLRLTRMSKTSSPIGDLSGAPHPGPLSHRGEGIPWKSVIARSKPVTSMADRPGQFDLFAPTAPRPAAVRPVTRLERSPEPPVAELAEVEERAELLRPPAPAQLLTVGQLTALLKGTVEPRFSRVAVVGEVSNFRRQTSGHLYFTLKDDQASLSVVMFRRDAQRLPFEIKDGLQLVGQGRIEIYGPHGKYQLIAEQVEPVGAGALALAYEQLKEKLAKEGLFAPERKRPIPFLPRCIGLITSPTGAALRDFLRVLHLRFPSLPVLVVPVKVQGDGAANEVVAALDRLSTGSEVDVVVVTRGGGSMEDLWSFNDERVARAIARCGVPVVSAIGHEIDFTIADFVADRRAPTPTGAAELLAPVHAELVASLAVATQRLRRSLVTSVQRRREALLRFRFALGDPRRDLGDRKLRLADLQDRLGSGLKAELVARHQALHRLHERLGRQSPQGRLAARLRELHLLKTSLERASAKTLALEVRRRWLAQLGETMSRAGRGLLQQRREQLNVAHARLMAISPQRVFERGYSLTRRAGTGALVRTAADVDVGDELEIVVAMRETEDDQLGLPGVPGTAVVEERIKARVLE
jgi:exodeoxyribonuclease VII large subunit